MLKVVWQLVVFQAIFQFFVSQIHVQEVLKSVTSPISNMMVFNSILLRSTVQYPSLGQVCPKNITCW